MGEDQRTTLMVRNIPNKYSCRMLLAKGHVPVEDSVLANYLTRSGHVGTAIWPEPRQVLLNVEDPGLEP